MFTLDGAQPDPRIPDFTFSQTPEEHKSYNLIRLDNGQFALQPNNRCLFYDNALAHAELKRPDFEVCTNKYTVEDKSKWLLGGATAGGDEQCGRREDGRSSHVRSHLMMLLLDRPVSRSRRAVHGH
jgi:hypothetical protein